jgi:N-acetylglucosaminyl-diphospho-decaprenol L-rhamnosyltransferase
MSSTTNLGFSRASTTANQRRDPLTIIIVSWNVKELLRNCLRSLADDQVPEWAEVVVFDNHSSDQSSEMVAAEFPWAKLIVNSQNVGFSRANNAACWQSNSDFVFLLNPDTVIHPGAVRKLVDFARAHPEVGAVGPKLCSADGSTQFEGAVDFPTIWNVFCDLALLSDIFPRSRIFCRRKMGYWDHEGDREVPGISGAAMLVRREALDRIGFLNETLFYAEDMDFCLRLRRAGWSVFYLSSASIVHYGGGSAKSVPHQGFHRQIAFQSTWLYTRENRGRIRAAALSAMVLFWSMGGVLATSLLGLFYREKSPTAEKIARFHEIAVSLLRWGVSNKKKFRHHLAAPPTFNAMGSSGTN